MEKQGRDRERKMQGRALEQGNRERKRTQNEIELEREINKRREMGEKKGNWNERIRDLKNATKRRNNKKI